LSSKASFPPWDETILLNSLSAVPFLHGLGEWVGPPHLQSPFILPSGSGLEGEILSSGEPPPLGLGRYGSLSFFHLRASITLCFRPRGIFFPSRHARQRTSSFSSPVYLRLLTWNSQRRPPPSAFPRLYVLHSRRSGHRASFFFFGCFPAINPFE